MKKIETKLPGVYIVEPQVFGDHRGYFMETWSTKNFEDIGLNYNFVQDNQSFTAQKGTLRGLHFQNDPMAQAKLVRVTKGAVLDVAVDLRKGSPTYKQWVAVELSAENKDDLKVQELNEKLRKAYGEIMAAPAMVEYNTAKAEVDSMVNDINTIISKCLEGEDPETVDPSSGCTGNCSSCGGSCG